LDERARRVRAGRLERGALMLDLPEARVVLDEDGNPVDIQRRERLETHRLIEDYMILANEVVANDMEEKKLSTMYRVHEPPAPEKLEGLNEILSHFGVKVPRHKALSPKDVQGLLEAVRGRDEELLVNSLILRSLKKARYHTENLGHFGLASSGYLHFTSPIRRYPDLVVHRVLTEALIHGEHEPYPDEAALAGMRLLAEGVGGDAPVVAGESGVAALAGLLAARANSVTAKALSLDDDSRVLVIGSEGATDPVLYRAIVGRSPEDVGGGN